MFVHLTGVIICAIRLEENCRALRRDSEFSTSWVCAYAQEAVPMYALLTKAWNTALRSLKDSFIENLLFGGRTS